MQIYDRRSLEAHIDGLIGCEGMEGLAREMAGLIVEIARDRGVRYGDDWDSVFAMPETDWCRLLNKAVRLEIIDAIEDAKTKWLDCDWTHERRDSDAENPVYCEGGQSETCDYCADVQSSAKSASSYGDEAIAALQRGDIGAALRAITSAEHLEDEWGDAPIWRPVLKLCEAAEKVSAADRDGDGGC